MPITRLQPRELEETEQMAPAGIGRGAERELRSPVTLSFLEAPLRHRDARERLVGVHQRQRVASRGSDHRFRLALRLLPTLLRRRVLNLDGQENGIARKAAADEVER